MILSTQTVYSHIEQYALKTAYPIKITIYSIAFSAFALPLLAISRKEFLTTLLFTINFIFLGVAFVPVMQGLILRECRDAFQSFIKVFEKGLSKHHYKSKEITDFFQAQYRDAFESIMTVLGVEHTEGTFEETHHVDSITKAFKSVFLPFYFRPVFKDWKKFVSFNYAALTRIPNLTRVFNDHTRILLSLESTLQTYLDYSNSKIEETETDCQLEICFNQMDRALSSLASCMVYLKTLSVYDLSSEVLNQIETDLHASLLGFETLKRCFILFNAEIESAENEEEENKEEENEYEENKEEENKYEENKYEENKYEENKEEENKEEENKYEENEDFSGEQQKVLTAHSETKLKTNGLVHSNVAVTGNEYVNVSLPILAKSLEALFSRNKRIKKSSVYAERKERVDHHNASDVMKELMNVLE
jgi:hypothetical protein